jgi:hypothetical protein
MHCRVPMIPLSVLSPRLDDNEIPSVAHRDYWKWRSTMKAIAPSKRIRLWAMMLGVACCLMTSRWFDLLGLS